MTSRPMVRAAVLFALSLTPAAAARADAPPLIPVQGYLTDSAGEAVDGLHRLTFLLYDAMTDGELLFTDDLSSVDIEQGHFITYLGAREDNELDLALFAGQSEVWLEIVIDGAETISPRTRLASVAYAAHAQTCEAAVEAAHAAEATHADEATHAGEADNASTLEGKAASAFASSTHTHAVTGCVAVQGACGTGTFNQPTYYLDRVGGTCPEATPVLRGISLARCGALGTPEEGLALRMTCCAIAAP